MRTGKEQGVFRPSLQAQKASGEKITEVSTGKAGGKTTAIVGKGGDEGICG